MPTADHQAVVAVLGGLLPEWRPDDIENVAYLPGGYANDNYRFEYEGAAYALRIVRRPGVDRRAEARFLELPCAPEVVAFDLQTGHLLTRWIPGDLLAEAPIPPATAAAYLRTLHTEIPAGIRRYDPFEVIRRDLDAADAVSPVAATTLDQIDWAPTVLRGCHNDLNPWNILRTDAGWRTLDWEFAGDNDPLFDLVCLGGGLGYDDTALERLADAYFGSPGIPPRRLLDTRVLFELREYAWATRQRTLGNERAEVRTQATRSERMLRTLLERRQGAT